MYPTLVIIVCAVSKSLNESSLEEGGASVVFQVPRDSRRELGVPTELAETLMQPVTVSAKHARYHCAKCPYVTLSSHNHGKG